MQLSAAPHRLCTRGALPSITAVYSILGAPSPMLKSPCYSLETRRPMEWSNAIPRPFEKARVWRLSLRIRHGTPQDADMASCLDIFSVLRCGDYLVRRVLVFLWEPHGTVVLVFEPHDKYSLGFEPQVGRHVYDHVPKSWISSPSCRRVYILEPSKERQVTGPSWRRTTSWCF